MYDFENRRVRKTVDGVDTIYPSNLFEVSDTGTSTKHIYVGEMLVASIEDDTPAPKIYYNHLDHLNSTRAVTDSTGYLVSELEFYPFGDTRIEGNKVSGTFYDTIMYMGRVPRVDIGGEVYHVINRANARLQIFFKDKDYQVFEEILKDGVVKFDMRILAYCIMPNHFHLVIHPKKDGDLQKFMQWLTLTHTQRWHAQNKTIGSGHLYQGRYKSFLIEKDKHLLTVIRYVERNPLRAKLVKKIQSWKYSSLYKRLQTVQNSLLSEWPVPVPKSYIDFVQTPLTASEIEVARYSVNRGKPFGKESWTYTMIDKYKLGITTRGRGRPKKGT